MSSTPWRRSTVKLQVDAAVEHEESATVPGGSPGPGFGKYWVRSDSPNVPMFTDDVGTDFVLTGGGGSSSGGAPGNIYADLQFYVDALDSSSYPGTGTTVTDLQANGTGGTLTTAVYTNGGFQFNGSSGKLVFTKDAALDNIFTGGGTVIAFFQTNSAGEASSGRVVTTEGTGSNVGWVLAVDAESNDYVRPFFTRNTNSADGTWVINDIQGNHPIRNGSWVGVGVSYDDASLSNDPTFYLQGEKVALTETTTPTGTIGSDAGEDLLIGNRSADDRTFNGTIGIVLLFDRALSAEEHALVFGVFGPRYGAGVKGRPQQTGGLPAADVSITAGDFISSATTTGSDGGDLLLRAGNTASGGSGSDAGNLYLFAGSASSNSRGGVFVLKGGSGPQGVTAVCEIGAGDVTSGNTSGSLLVHGGDNTSTGSAGNLTCRAGDSSQGPGGDLFLTAGNSSGVGDDPGDIFIRSGENGNTLPQTGDILITTDRVTGTGGGTGNVTIETGENGSNSTAVGTITLRGGDAAGTGDAGSIALIAGANTSTSNGAGGSISLTAGNSVDEDGGSITCVAGSSTSTDAADPAGSFVFTAGNQTGTGSVAGSGGGGFTFTAGSSAKTATTSPAGSFTVTAGAGTANSANARGGDVTLTAGAVTGSTAGALAGSVTVAGGAATVGTNGRVSLTTSGNDAPVGVRTQGTFTGTIKESLTNGQQKSLPSGTIQTTLVTLGTVATAGHNMKLNVYVTGVNNSSTDEVVSHQFIQTFYQNAGGGLTALTAHMSDSKNSGAGGFTTDVTFNLAVSGNNIILRALNTSSSTTYTANLSIEWDRQEGGFTS